MGHKEKEAMINTFVHSNFNYGYLIWHISSKKSQNKVGRIREMALKLHQMTTQTVMQNVLKNPYQY